MFISLRPPSPKDGYLNRVEDGTVIAIAIASDDESGRTTHHSLVGVEQGDWVDEVHIARKNGDSKYGYVLYLPES